MGGIDVNVDGVWNLQSMEINLIVGAGFTAGANAGGAWTTGPLLIWNAPTNADLGGADIVYVYKGGDIPIPPLNLEIEASHPLQGGATIVYIGGSPVGVGGGEVGIHTGISFTLFNLRLFQIGK